MKKIIKSLSLLALSAMVFFACDKTDRTPAATDQDKPSAIDWSGYDANTYLLGFGADIVAPDTKVAIDFDANTLTFEEGDLVKVYAPNAEGTKVGTYKYDQGLFVPNSEADAILLGTGEAFLYYPAGSFDAEAATLTMPSAVGDQADLGDKNPMAGHIDAGAQRDEDGHLQVSFKNLCSILRVKVKGTRTLSEVKLENANVPVAAAGSYTVGWTDGAPTLTSSATGYAATIATDATLSDDTATEFYFLLPPTAATMNDMVVTVTATTEIAGGQSSISLTRNGAMTLTRNKIINLDMYAGLFSGGSGTEADPYKIANARDFKNIANYTTNGFGSLTGASFLAAHYLQTADIDFGEATIPGVGKYISATDFSAAFSGTYDGGNKTLANYKISYTASNGTGTFAASNGATFKNINISGIDVQGKSYVGGLVGLAADGTTFENCTIGGAVKSNGGATGGIVGYIFRACTITGCHAKALAVGPIDTATGNNFGGIVGYIASRTESITISITDCDADAESSITVNGTKGQAGGIVGGNAMDTDGKVKLLNCTNAATIDAQLMAGGIAGIFNSGSVTSCTNSGKVTLNSTSSSNTDTGGIVGQIRNGTILECKNTGAVNSNKTFCGGLVGRTTTGTVTISKSINLGQVIGSNSNTGGLVGYINTTTLVERCYNNAQVEGSARIGGLVGHLNHANALIINCVSQGNTISKNSISDITDGKNGAVGGLVGTLTNGTVANCVHRDAYVIYRNANLTADWQKMACIGGIVGHVRAGTVQNCYTYRTCNNIGACTTGTTIVYQSHLADSKYMGQVYGYNEGGTVKDCYCRNHGTFGYSFGTNTGTIQNVTVMGGGTTDGLMNNNYNSIVTYSDGNTGTDVTLSDGTTTYPAASTYVSEMLSGGSALISYTGGVTLLWEMPADMNYWCYPSAIVALFGYCNNAATFSGCSVSGKVGNSVDNLLTLSADNYFPFVGQAGTNADLTQISTTNIAFSSE